MTQNIYDDATFFAAYSRLPRSLSGLDGAPEWPALRALLPAMRGLNVLDLGCGFGWFCRWARQQGAARIVGIDVSENMRARTMTDDPAIGYTRADLEHLDLPAASFELVYSSLALHYIEDLERLMARVQACLVAGGRLVFSVEHPLMTAPTYPGWSVDAAGRKAWPIDTYLDEGARDELARRGRHQAASHAGNLYQHAARARLHPCAHRGMGTCPRANRRAARPCR